MCWRINAHQIWWQRAWKWNSRDSWKFCKYTGVWWKSRRWSLSRYTGLIPETLEPNQTQDFDESQEDDPSPDAHNEEASDEAQDGSQQANQSKNTFKYKSSHPDDLIIGNKESPRRTRSYFRQEESMMGLLSMIEPATVEEALTDDGWIIAMQEELNQFQRNDIWDLIIKLDHKNIIGTKWVFRNKLNEKGDWSETKLDLLLKVTVNKKALIILKHLLQLQDWKKSGHFYPMQ